MDYFILSNSEPIGTILSPQADPTMGIVFGPFTPLPAYEKVRPIFQLYSHAKGSVGEPDDEDKLARFYRERDALTLSVTTANGLTVPTSSIHVFDLSEKLSGTDAYEAEFQVPPSDVFAPSGTFFKDERYWDNSLDS